MTYDTTAFARFSLLSCDRLVRAAAEPACPVFRGRRKDESSGQDVACGIDVRIAPVPAGDTREDHLALTVRPCYIPTDTALQRHVGRVNLDHGNPRKPGPSVQTDEEPAPPLGQNVPAESGLGPSPVGKELPRVRPWAGGSHEGRYVQVLDYNQVVIPHQGRGYLFNPVMAPTHWPGMGFRRSCYFPRMQLTSYRTLWRTRLPGPKGPGLRSSLGQLYGF